MPFLNRYSSDIEGGAFFSIYQNLESFGENIIYISQRLINCLANSKEVFCDATLKVIPKYPKNIQQILTVHFMYMDKVCVRRKSYI